jgi:acyl-coenzyme A thioesterase PaaI-like protein
VRLPRLLDHGCFACGTANPQGLQMTFSREGDRVVSELALPPHLMGWDRIAHGGIVSTLLDEVMAYAVIAFERWFFVTHTMQVRYLRPVPLEVPLRVEAWIAPRSESLDPENVRSVTPALAKQAQPYEPTKRAQPTQPTQTTEGDEPKGCYTRARILDADEVPLARAEAWMRFIPAHRLGLVTARLREDMEELFAKMAELEQ